MAMKLAHMAFLVVGSVLLAASAFGSAPACAQTIIDEWAGVKTPPPPALKQVKADPKTMAFLVLDLFKQGCNEQQPRCAASLPKVAKFLGEARAHNMPVVYSLAGERTLKDVADQVAPKGDEPTVRAHADKLVGTDLEKILKDRGVTTVIVVGTAAQGAVLYTASHAAFLGFKVVVPVDGSTSDDAFDELAVVRTLAVAPFVSSVTTLTLFDMIGW
jgi:nicotinamidase-related amidase